MHTTEKSKENKDPTEANRLVVADTSQTYL
jgi:hypothetical protein